MIIKGKKTNKKKVKSKSRKSIKRTNPDQSAIDDLVKLLDKRGEKSASINSDDWIHYHELAKEIEGNNLEENFGFNPSKKELLDYLKRKRIILEGVIADFIAIG